MKPSRYLSTVLAAFGCLLWTTFTVAAEPASIRLEPESPKDADEHVRQRIPWKELNTEGFTYDSSILNSGYIPKAIVLEGTDKPTEVTVQYRVKGGWYWSMEGPGYEIPSLAANTSEWINLKVAPEGWVLLPDYFWFEEAAGPAEKPAVEDVLAALKKDYPADKGEDLALLFSNQLKESGKDTLLDQITHGVGVIEIRFAAKGKELPEKAQMTIVIVPGC